MHTRYSVLALAAAAALMLVSCKPTERISEEESATALADTVLVSDPYPVDVNYRYVVPRQVRTPNDIPVVLHPAQRECRVTTHRVLDFNKHYEEDEIPDTVLVSFRVRRPDVGKIRVYIPGLRGFEAYDSERQYREPRNVIGPVNLSPLLRALREQKAAGGPPDHSYVIFCTDLDEFGHGTELPKFAVY